MECIKLPYCQWVCNIVYKQNVNAVFYLLISLSCGNSNKMEFNLQNLFSLFLLYSQAVQCQQEKCATMLLEHGADPNLVDVNSSTALHLAAQTANISLAVLLLEYNAHIEAQNKVTAYF